MSSNQTVSSSGNRFRVIEQCRVLSSVVECCQEVFLSGVKKWVSNVEMKCKQKINKKIGMCIVGNPGKEY